jgi:hypothetical protein
MAPWPTTLAWVPFHHGINCQREATCRMIALVNSGDKSPFGDLMEEAR